MHAILRCLLPALFIFCPAARGTIVTTSVDEDNGSLGGGTVLSFALDSAAASGTRWILKRSPDLKPGSFSEIYRFDGGLDTVVPGVTFLRRPSDITITDTTATPGGAFYRFEACLET